MATGGKRDERAHDWTLLARAGKLSRRGAIRLFGAGAAGIAFAGGRALAQDQASCVVPGMPAAAVALGAVDEVVPLGELAARIAAAWTPAC